jgi:hypothetical protein
MPLVPLICIKPAEGAVVSLPMARRIGLERAASKVPCVPGSSGAFDLRENNMKLSIAVSALLVAGFMTVTTEPASAVVYCQYVDYPVGCTVRAGVVLRPRPVARAVATPGVGRVGTPTNRGGPVDRVGRR